MSGITLTTPFSITGSVTEDDTQAAVSSMSINWYTGVVTCVFNLGVVSGNALTPGAIAPQVTFVVNMITGAWYTLSSDTAVYPNQTGTFSGAGFTSFQTMFTGIRNDLEGFAASASEGGGFLAGTQTAWTEV